IPASSHSAGPDLFLSGAHLSSPNTKIKARIHGGPFLFLEKKGSAILACRMRNFLYTAFASSSYWLHRASLYFASLPRMLAGPSLWAARPTHQACPNASRRSPLSRQGHPDHPVPARIFVSFR